ncbi:hypothetical protein HOB10_02240 [Candidatus Parcubacteria bacterium]|jgi:hypothetical protein|nr:hypothetical protein [Candidatus Parcubacteria bacterium]
MIFNYSTKTKVISIVILVAVIIFTVVFVRYNNSRSNDLELAQQVKILANGLEEYYEKFNSYPISDTVSVAQISNITDKGFNSDGDIVYFVQNFKWTGGANYISDGKQYTIDFVVNNSWDSWGITKMAGGNCQVTTNVMMECINKP